MLAPLQFLPEMPSIRHGFFTRKGGVSKGHYQSLNCRLASKDNPDHIKENRRRVAAYFDAKPSHLMTLQQVHSPSALIVDRPWSDGKIPQADALVTKQKGLVLGTLTADCGSVLFADPVAHIIGSAHSGWRGATGGILEATLEQMVTLGSNIANIHVALGPTISQKHYEVDDTFRQNLIDIDADNTQFFTPSTPQKKPHFNLPHYIKNRLTQAGVNHLFISSECTYDNESKYFSFRVCSHNGHSDYGCQISAIMLY